MEFRLTYAGPLKANGGLRHKQMIRRHLHRQLKVLWQQPPLSDHRGCMGETTGREEIALLTPVGPFEFVPLVSAKIALVADISLVFLRPGPPGALAQGGDIDNRLKTLLDALRMPQDPRELPQGDEPAEDEKPFFCLLEDDKLITSLSVTTDRLLKPSADASEVFLLMHVVVRPTRILTGYIDLLGW